MYVERAQLAALEPSNLASLVVECRLAAQRPSDQRDLELLPGFSVRVLHDVSGIRVDAQQTGDLRSNPGLLFALPDGTFARRLAEVLCTTWKGPLTGVAAPLK